MTYLPHTYIIGLDLGKKRDYTALAVLDQQDDPSGGRSYTLVHLERWRDRDYLDCIPAIRRVSDALQQKNQNHYQAYRQQATMWTDLSYHDAPISLIVDQTGVGEAVIESLRNAGLDCYGVMIHGGDSVSRMDGGWRVPKRELVGTVEVLLQNQRLKFSKGLALADVLQAELQSFKATIKLSTGHVSYAADETWREGEHDDTVLALCMAAWFAEQDDPHAWDELNRYYSRQ